MLFAFYTPKAAPPTPANTKEKFLQMVIPSDILVSAVFKFFITGCFNLALYWLPIYFQAVRGVSAISSGVRLIPVILSLTITQIAVGGAITATGIHNPFLILGPAIAAVGAGLLMLLNEQSSTGRWIGFQIILEVGVGFCLTIPLMLSQVVVQTKDVSTATPIIIFFLEPSREVLRKVTAAHYGLHSRSVFHSLLASFFMPWFRYHDTSKKPTAETALTRSEREEKRSNAIEARKGEENKETDQWDEVHSRVP
ncbi:hypothetical protein F4814DRAFT_445691 [Daldinia grandis]|nr:hypothetical protein F4814DRAFT_445691 [Daldinia grandis]